ncbi:MAG: GspE/PulE family protein [Deltaproteobacteria bacterium]|nr:GspE/PulE family protein [Deltaproteobacteria bacterium]
MPTEKLQKELQYREKLTGLINLIHGSQDVSEIIVDLKPRLLELVDAERLTIYAIDAKTQQVFSLYKEGDEIREIREARGLGSLVGYCALSGQTLNIKDAYNPALLRTYHPDLKFDDSWDRRTGFRTRQVLTLPIPYQKYLMGVLQLLNKRDGTEFSAEDLEAAKEIAETLGIALYNRRRLAKPRAPNRFAQLIERGLIPEKGLEEALSFARMNNQKVANVLVDKYTVAKEEVLKSLAQFYGTGYFAFDGSQRMPDACRQRFKHDYLTKIVAAPVSVTGGVAKIAVEDPSDLNMVDTIRVMQLAPRHEFLVALDRDIVEYINASYGQAEAPPSGSVSEILVELTGEESGAEPADQEGEVVNESDSAIVRLANKIIMDGYDRNASDIHVEPMGRTDPTRIRFRIDGECMVYQEIPPTYRQALVSRLKIMASLDISEKRKPQDGKIRFRAKQGTIELRVATIPTTGQEEDVVMRILAASKPIPLDDMGFSPRNLAAFKEAVSKPYGIILCVGPTGSGKTTTLHSALGFINTPDLKVWTAEDPVEITQKGLRQVQVQPKIDFTFAAAMRAFLRADPDVIMVGEMRDQETAQTGVEASLTGHLVLSTLHTNSAPETVVRLIDMGIDPFNFADSLLGILAQRLVRKLCKKCKQAYAPSAKEFKDLADLYGQDAFERLGIRFSKDLMLYSPGNCPECGGTGYKGRAGVHELLIGTDEMKRLIQAKGSVEAMREQAIKDGMTTLLQDGIEKILAGHTDLKQVRAVCIK